MRCEKPNKLVVKFVNDGPVLAVEHRTGIVEVLWPLDVGYAEAWHELPEEEQRWSPSWGFFPGEFPERDPPGTVY